MIRRTYAPAQPTLTSGEERPVTPCQIDVDARMEVKRTTGEYPPSPFDVLIDEPVGPRYLIARDEARTLCGACPIRDACLTEHADHAWAKAVIGRWRDDRAERREIAAWAAANGHTVHRQGPIKRQVLDAYHAAQQEAS